jgi:2,3-bisphosphoglycerate-independent phosphoglycerate mutase
MLEMCKKNGLTNVFVHAFLDGRDTPPASGKDFLAALQSKMDEIGVGKIASLSGRYYAMDRDNNWDRVEKAYNSLVKGEGVQATSVPDAMQASYDDGVTDEFVLPTVITDADGKPVSLVKPNDSVIFFNFRPDRARQITRAFCMTDEEIAATNGDVYNTKSICSLKRANGFMPLTFVCFKNYEEAINNKLVAFEKKDIVNTFGEIIAANGLKQLRLAETEKYAHVTFFFNGGREAPYEGEDRILVPSPKVATYDLKPEMSAFEVKDKLVAAIDTQKYDWIVVNYANGDMVGHTGVYAAVEKAVVAIDQCVKETVEAAKANGYEVLIIADHGNADNELNPDGTPNTAHSLNPVPFIYVTSNKSAKVEDGILADVAPSILHIMGLEQPAEMTGKCLIKD